MLVHHKWMMNNFLNDLRGHQRRIDAHENLWQKYALNTSFFKVNFCSRSKLKSEYDEFNLDE